MKSWKYGNENIEKLIENFHCATLVSKPNLFDIKRTVLNFSRDTAKLFNTLVKYFEMKDYQQFNWTESGGISKVGLVPPFYGIKRTTSHITLVFSYGMNMYRLDFGPEVDEKRDITGKTAFDKFKEICSHYNIDLNDYAIDKEEGRKIKENFPKPMVAWGPHGTAVRDITYKATDQYGIYHIDLNSAFMSGLVANHKEFEGPVSEIYNKRKDDDVIYKGILTHTYGYMQSVYTGFKWAHLSKEMVEFTNNYLLDLTKKIEKNGAMVLLYNTDGIWYIGKQYHDENEQPNVLGKWKCDHSVSKLRIHGLKAYEYVENDQYKICLAGLSKLDRAKPREEWTWGEYLEHPLVQFGFSKNRIIYEDIEKGELIEYYEI